MDYGTAPAGGYAVASAPFQRVQAGRGTFIGQNLLERPRQVDIVLQKPMGILQYQEMR